MKNQRLSTSGWYTAYAEKLYRAARVRHFPSVMKLFLGSCFEHVHVAAARH